MRAFVAAWHLEPSPRYGLPASSSINRSQQTVGPSGVGKTTFSLMLSAITLLTPSDGMEVTPAHKP